MKLLLYSLNFAPEPVGIGKYSGDLAEWLAAKGHDVRVITTPPYFPEWQARGNCYRKSNLEGVEVWRCPLWVPKRPGGLKRLCHLASFAISSLPVVLLQWSWRPDVIVTVAPAFFCVPGALLFGRMCAKSSTSWLHIQDFELDAAFELGILKGSLIRTMAESLEKSLLRGFDMVSTISEAMRQRTILKGVEPCKSTLLPNWVDLQLITQQGAGQKKSNPYRSELNIPEGSCILLYSGSMNKKQGLELIIETIHYLYDQKNIFWLFAGEGPTKADIAKKTEGMDNVILLPLQPLYRLNDWLNLADIHLVPQKGGAADLVLPSKLMGILASGKCMVASSPAGSELGNLAEQAGIRVDPEDRIGFASAIIRLMNDDILRQQLGNRGRNIAEQYYGKDTVLQGFENLLINQLNKRITRGNKANGQEI